MINVFCLFTGNKYSIDYVKKLKEGVSKNLSLPHKFICLTDKQNHYKAEGVEFIHAPVDKADSWCKLSLFTTLLADKYKGTALYLDLDVVITGSIDVLIKNANLDKLNIIGDWWREGYNSSVMIWELGKFHKIYNNFKPSDLRRLNGDQDLINEVVHISEAKLFGKVQVQSYKANELQKDFNKQTKIVVFHGKPKPHECGGWVQKYW